MRTSKEYTPDWSNDDWNRYYQGCVVTHPDAGKLCWFHNNNSTSVHVRAITRNEKGLFLGEVEAIDKDKMGWKYLARPKIGWYLYCGVAPAYAYSLPTRNTFKGLKRTTMKTVVPGVISGVIYDLFGGKRNAPVFGNIYSSLYPKSSFAAADAQVIDAAEQALATPQSYEQALAEVKSGALIGILNSRYVLMPDFAGGIDVWHRDRKIGKVDPSTDQPVMFDREEWHYSELMEIGNNEAASTEEDLV